MAINMTLTKPTPKLSLGPVQYYWPKEMLLEFYQHIGDSAVDIIYLGEVVCSKRLDMRFNDWIELANTLRDKGKEVILSTMTLIEASSERSRMQRICEQSDFQVEANDFGAIAVLSKLGKKFITGSSINIYNNRSLKILQSHGMQRWNLSVELGKTQLETLQQNRPANVETELLVWGRLPLAYSARCFSARAHNLPKDQCQFKCLNDADGIIMKTRDRQDFLCLNGIQTQSALTCNLIDEIDSIKNLSVDVIRISPQSQHTVPVIEAFHQVISNTCTATRFQQQLADYAVTGLCNGYWFGNAGMSHNNQLGL
ncbi:Uncharacterized peptidase U32 family member YhbV [hydrothermal vent metagenome]|uniref:Uncharacterized peptidase U32 family member YhbV n=1 Tax=hydrothermal vent metagenome TaxID=652676 RepID=A0A3B0VZX9_9ZZZZ